MATINQLQAGILKYINTDVLPHIEGWKKLAVGGYINLASANFPGLLMQIKNHPAVSVLGVFDDENNIDIDKLHAALDPMFESGEKYTVPIPMAGDLIINKSDLEKIFRYVKEAQA